MADSDAPTRKIQVANSRPEDSGRGLAHMPRTLIAGARQKKGPIETTSP
jgi:transitional endoplasmic reticulum ATPase